MSNTARNFDILETNLSILHNYLIQTTLFSDLNLVKFLDTLANISFFPCMLLLNEENNIVYNIVILKQKE